ncbi:MAG TPA: AI-2E family transporter [Bryobacteraceae bacterium]|nr:AI-2E family transporter [Bryobacteraceae bacterium]
MQHSKRIVLFVFSLALAGGVAYYVRGALLLVYVSIVFAVVLSPAVDRVHQVHIGRWRPGRGAAMLLIISGLLVLAAAFLLFVLPPIVGDIQDLGRRLPEHLRRLNAGIKNLPFGDRINFETIGGIFEKLIGGVPGIVSQAAQVLVSVATVLILTAYLILDGSAVFAWSMSLIPAEERGRLRAALVRAGLRMRNWLVGQAVLMLVLGSSSALVFGLLGVRYFFALAVFAGVANVVPLLGPIVTVVLASLVAATDSFGKVLGVWVFYFVYQQVENAFLTPRIMQTQVQLSPVAVVIALLLGSELAGIPGALVAVPSAVLVSVLTNEYLVQTPKS